MGFLGTAYRRVAFIASVIATVSTHAGHPRQKIDHLLLIVGEAIGVELLADRRVFRRLFLVLVEYPFQPGTIAQPVGPDLWRNARQAGFRIEPDCPVVAVGPQQRLGRHARRARLFIGHVGAGQRPGL